MQNQVGADLPREGSLVGYLPAHTCMTGLALSYSTPESACLDAHPEIV